VATPSPLIQDLPSRFSKLWGGVERDDLNTLFRQRVACQNHVRREVARSSEAFLIDLDLYVCPDGRCKRHLGQSLLRPDGMHFEGAGASWASSWILDQLREAL